MLRSIDAIDGPGIYTINLMDNLLEFDKKNEYVLFYKTKKNFGRYSKYNHVKETLIEIPGKLIWDQIAIPIVALKEKVDIILNPKFSVPFITRLPTIMVLHGSEWYIYPKFYNKLDILYINLVMPLYCWKATKLIAVSDVIKLDLTKYANAPLNKITTIYIAHNEKFHLIDNKDELERIRKKYNLHQEFILTVTRAYPGKNVEGIIKAYHKCKDRIGYKLVVVGKNIKEYLLSKKINQDHLDDVIFMGYVPQEDLPAMYNIAKLFIFPSFYESFGMPLVEAMSCGCPIITSNAGGSPEIVGNAAMLTNPADIEEISSAICEVLNNEDLRYQLIQRGLNRAKFFSWEKTVKETLHIIESLDKI